MIKKYLGLIAVCSIAMAACNKDPEPVVTPGQHVNNVYAKVDATSFYSDDASYLAGSNRLDIKGVRINGSKSSSITLTMKQYAGLSSYTIDSNTTAIYEENTGTYKATSGTVNVTTDNVVHVAGNFSFVAMDSTRTKTVSGGTFDIYK